MPFVPPQPSSLMQPHSAQCTVLRRTLMKHNLTFVPLGILDLNNLYYAFI